MNRLSTKERAQIVGALTEGMSIRAVCRLTGRSKNTVARLLVELGEACLAYHDAAFRGLKSKRLQADEIWAFCYAKAKNVPEDKKGLPGYGDVWTFTCIDADSKIMVSWLAGQRDARHAYAFMTDVASRVEGRVQLTTDGFGAYTMTVPLAFNGDVDFAQLIKSYASVQAEEGRYSPPVCTGCVRKPVTGNPDPDHVSTSYVERSNLTLRMGQRRWTRLTNAHSKKLENLEAALALHMTHYNLCRPHQSLGGKTPAQAAGVEDRRWTIEDLICLLVAREEAQGTPNAN